MKRVIGAAAMLLAGAVGSAAAADLYGAGGYGGGGEGGRHHGRGHRAFHGAAADGSYGEPRFFPGRAFAEPGPGLIVEYREPYIGRGLVYNVPPDLYGPRSRRGVVTARY